jgi:N-formylmaleamate deformylase
MNAHASARDGMISSVAVSRYVDSDGVRLHALDYGEGGPPVLVLPGITSPAATWEFAALELARDQRVVVLDQRGRGNSDTPRRGYGLPEYAADAAAVIRALDLEGVIVLGHSLGARVAARLELDEPELIGDSLLVDPPLTGPGRGPYPYALSFYVDAIRRARDGMTVDELRALQPGWSDEQLQIRIDWLGTCDERAVEETYRNFTSEDFIPLWRRLESPLLIRGERSTVVTEEGVAELRVENPHAEIITVPGAGHMIAWENLEGFLEAVLPWL